MPRWEYRVDAVSFPSPYDSEGMVHQSSDDWAQDAQAAYLEVLNRAGGDGWEYIDGQVGPGDPPSRAFVFFRRQLEPD